jgi:hypothetical protein
MVVFLYVREAVIHGGKILACTYAHLFHDM